MSLFFSGAVTSSPIKRRLRANDSCQSLDASLLSPDSSYVCYPSVGGAEPCCCRRSPRLLTNGYYDVTEDSFTWDDHGNVSLTPCKTSVSYKENLVRVFRRRRRPRGSLARLLSDVTESCQSWLDENVFRGVFFTGNRDQDQDRDEFWTRTSDEGKQEESGFGATELDDGLGFTYGWFGVAMATNTCDWWDEAPVSPVDEDVCSSDHTEIPAPPDKVAPPPEELIQEEICSEISQSLGGLSEVPPPSPFYTSGCCCQTSPEPTGLTMKTLLLLIFTIFIVTVLYSRSLMWSVSVASTVFVLISAFMLLTKSGPMGEWRRAKTEDITSRNE
ncbi:transmembrane protein 71 isoform X1 [Antennarius striatus]|uniref:transmembrane protein 71 isoform X1 n=1 Tax=Antennarius striatus TaxID=241820 RepID=UPI0035AE1F0D